MADVKGRVRQQRAQETRRRIVDAARTLFRDRGFAATTIEAIAAEAGVAVPTVYKGFASKAGLLEGLREVMQSDAGMPALMQRARDEPRADRTLALWAQLIRRQMEHAYDIIAIHREAARVDPDFATFYRGVVLSSRAAVMRGIVETIEPDLAPDVNADTATDLMWVYSTEELWRELVGERHWTPDRFERWLARTLRQQLLGHAISARPGASVG